MCPYESYIINAAKSYQRIILTCEKKLVLEVIHGNSCVCVENLVPIVVTDIFCMILKTDPAILTSVEIISLVENFWMSIFSRVHLSVFGSAL